MGNMAKILQSKESFCVVSFVGLYFTEYAARSDSQTMDCLGEWRREGVCTIWKLGIYDRVTNMAVAAV
jgi:hypothetical protein